QSNNITSTNDNNQSNNVSNTDTINNLIEELSNTDNINENLEEIHDNETLNLINEHEEYKNKAADLNHVRHCPIFKAYVEKFIKLEEASENDSSSSNQKYQRKRKFIGDCKIIYGLQCIINSKDLSLKFLENSEDFFIRKSIKRNTNHERNTSKNL
ncbi:hypothetical protein EDEG_03298, partial [Edhazardia aedis USNM 41457]